MNISDELRRDISQWCQYNYGGNLTGVALFDPTQVSEEFPNSDVNILIMLKSAPLESRERYDEKATLLVDSIAPDKAFTCRIQTVEEIDVLSNMKLPLLKIYLTNAEILYDPQNILQQARSKL